MVTLLDKRRVDKITPRICSISQVHEVIAGSSGCTASCWKWKRRRIGHRAQHDSRTWHVAWTTQGLHIDFYASAGRFMGHQRHYVFDLSIHLCVHMCMHVCMSSRDSMTGLPSTCSFWPSYVFFHEIILLTMDLNLLKETTTHQFVVIFSKLLHVIQSFYIYPLKWAVI